MTKGVDYISDVYGHWTEELFIDGVQYWHIDDFIGFKIRQTKKKTLLPSDCKFREDLQELLKGDEDNAQVRIEYLKITFEQRWKEVLEDIQRLDRKLREESAYGRS